MGPAPPPSVSKTLRYQRSYGKNVDKTVAQKLKNMAEGANSVLIDEGMRTTVILTTTEPPDAVTNLENLEPHQEALRQDLITCLKAHLARPAIVTAWALGYDLVRSWIFKDSARLAAFNAQLASSHRKGEPAAVNQYHDFFKLGEYRFLEICRNSNDPALNDFTDNTLRDLQALLDDRNKFAHANFNIANEHEANAYVVRLLRIVTSPPFKPT